MSKRNSREARKINKLRKTLRKNSIPAYIDLVQWLRDHKHADTAGAAQKLITEGRVKSDSHTLGLTPVHLEGGKEIQVPSRFVPAKYRPTISVEAAT